jgi:hypothetical protein
LVESLLQLFGKADVLLVEGQENYYSMKRQTWLLSYALYILYVLKPTGRTLGMEALGLQFHYDDDGKDPNTVLRRRRRGIVVGSLLISAITGWCMDRFVTIIHNDSTRRNNSNSNNNNNNGRSISTSQQQQQQSQGPQPNNNNSLRGNDRRRMHEQLRQQMLQRASTMTRGGGEEEEEEESNNNNNNTSIQEEHPTTEYFGGSPTDTVISSSSSTTVSQHFLVDSLHRFFKVLRTSSSFNCYYFVGKLITFFFPLILFVHSICFLSNFTSICKKVNFGRILSFRGTTRSYNDRWWREY